MKPVIILFFCSLLGVARAEMYLDAAAVFARLRAPAINGRDRASGVALESGWQFGAAGRHAITLGLQSVQWSGAHTEYATVYGNGFEARSLRTRLDTLLLGYAWEVPLAPAWRLRLAAGAGLGRIHDTTQTRSITFNAPPGPWSRSSGTESAEACGRVAADVRWYFSSRGHLLLGVEWMRKAADDVPHLSYGSFGTATATIGKLGIGFGF